MNLQAHSFSSIHDHDRKRMKKWSDRSLDPLGALLRRQIRGSKLNPKIRVPTSENRKKKEIKKNHPKIQNPKIQNPKIQRRPINHNKRKKKSIISQP
jgi:hypothetical protein